MSHFVKIDGKMFRDLLDVMDSVKELLDNVHCYDSDEYLELNRVIKSIKWENISE